MVNKHLCSKGDLRVGGLVYYDQFAVQIIGIGDLLHEVDQPADAAYNTRGSAPVASGTSARRRQTRNNSWWFCGLRWWKRTGHSCRPMAGGCSASTAVDAGVPKPVPIGIGTDRPLALHRPRISRHIDSRCLRDGENLVTQRRRSKKMENWRVAPAPHVLQAAQRDDVVDKKRKTQTQPPPPVVGSAA